MKCPVIARVVYTCLHPRNQSSTLTMHPFNPQDTHSTPLPFLHEALRFTHFMWLTYLSLHCLPERPGRCLAISLQRLLLPYISTTCVTTAQQIAAQQIADRSTAGCRSQHSTADHSRWQHSAAQDVWKNRRYVSHHTTHSALRQQQNNSMCSTGTSFPHLHLRLGARVRLAGPRCALLSNV
jgi:hypothetical protein